MSLFELITPGSDFWVDRDNAMMAVSQDRSARMAAAAQRDMASAARAAWTQAKIQASMAQMAAMQGVVLVDINKTLRETFTAIGESNEKLDAITGQLAQTNTHLQELRATQDEHLNLVKRERTLKEVLFRLSQIIDQVLHKEDGVAQIATRRYCLSTLDRYRLGTSDLSEIEDKRLFDRFVRDARDVLRNAAKEAIDALEDFEAIYALYLARVEAGLVDKLPPKKVIPEWGDVPTDGSLAATSLTDLAEGEGRDQWVFDRYRIPPRFVAGTAPVWAPSKPLAPFVPADQPKLQLKALPARPNEPEFPKRPDAPAQSFWEIPVTDPGDPPPVPDATLLPPGYEPPTAESVPTEADTDKRLPPSATWGQFFRYPKDMTAARDYEKCLRKWKAAKDNYIRVMSDWQATVDAIQVNHEQQLAEWQQACAAIEAENLDMEEVGYPQILAHFAEAEAARKAAHDEQSREFEEAERRRRDAWEHEVREFEYAEKIRREAFDSRLEEFQREEQERKKVFDTRVAELQAYNLDLDNQLVAAIQRFEGVVAEYAALVNDFLDKHPDVEQFFERVDAAADLRKHRRDWAVVMWGSQSESATADAMGVVASRTEPNGEPRTGKKKGGSQWEVVLTNPGPEKAEVIKAIRAITSLSPEDAKKLVTDYPSVVRAGLSADKAQKFAERLRAAGAASAVRSAS